MQTHTHSLSLFHTHTNTHTHTNKNKLYGTSVASEAPSCFVVIYWQEGTHEEIDQGNQEHQEQELLGLESRAFVEKQN